MYLSSEQYALFIHEYTPVCETYKPVYTFKWSNYGYMTLILFSSKSPEQTENKGIIKMSGSAKNVHSEVLIYLFLAESPFLQLSSSSELIKHLANGECDSDPVWCPGKTKNRARPLSSLSHSKYTHVSDFSVFSVYPITLREFFSHSLYPVFPCPLKLPHLKRSLERNFKGSLSNVLKKYL